MNSKLIFRLFLVFVLFVWMVFAVVSRLFQPSRENRAQSAIAPAVSSDSKPYVATDGSKLSEAKRLLGYGTKELNAWARRTLKGIRKGDKDYAEAQRLLATIPHDRKAEAHIEAKIKAPVQQRGTPSSTELRREFESAGLHRTPTGRIYQVDVSRSGYAVVYDYSGAISGQVVTNLMGMVLSDTRQFPK
jgi:hypothetical protein